MSAQTYRDPVAIARMRAGLCPECGGSPESHTDSVAFWIPRSNYCSLLPYGVEERIAWQLHLDRDRQARAEELLDELLDEGGQ